MPRRVRLRKRVPEVSPDLATITGRGTKRGTELMLLAFAVAVSLTVGAGSFHGGDVSALLASRGGHSNAEIEARAVRDVALSGAAEEVFLGVARKSAPIAVLGGILLTLLRRR